MALPLSVRLSACALLLLLPAGVRCADETSPDLRYDLAVGDHLVFRETLVQDVTWPEHERSTRAVWRTHVLVMARRPDGWVSVGFARVSTEAALTRFRERGRDRLDEEQPRFAQRLSAWPPLFAEANVLDARGTPGLPWNAVREWWSHTLFDVHELPVLPRAGVGSVLDGGLGFKVRAVARMETADGPAWRVTAGNAGDLALTYDFAEATRLPTHVELEGRYDELGTRIHEKLTFDLVERRREEGPEAWRADDETRAAAETATAAAAVSLPPGAPVLSGTPLLPIREGRFAGWPYIVRVPEGYRAGEARPLLLYLSGGPGHAFTGALSSAGESISRDWLVAYPQAVSDWWSDDSMAMLDALVEDVLARFTVDPNRVYIVGASNGATGALRYASLVPQRFAAVVSLMGAGRRVPENDPPHLGNLSRTAVLLVHGDKDPIIDVECSRDAAAEIRRAARDAPVELRILSGRGHDIHPGDDRGLSAPFLRRAVRDPFPRRLDVAIGDAAHPRRHWVEVVDKARGTAQVTAEVRGGNRLEVRARGVRRLRLHLRPELFPEPGAVSVIVNGEEIFQGPLGEAAVAASTDADPFLVARRVLDVSLGKADK